MPSQPKTQIIPQGKYLTAERWATTEGECHDSAIVTMVCACWKRNRIPGEARGESATRMHRRPLPTSAAYDLGEKFTCYHSLPSLREYLPSEQDQPRIALYRHDPDRHRFTGVAATLDLATAA